ncbi:hypothetical protein JCM8208_003320 [Rhodotorula glutinis]
MASSTALFASPLGSMHHQPPSQQATAARTLLAFLRRDKSSSSSTTTSSKKRSPQLECAIKRSTKSTYTAYHADDEASRSPPPPYTAIGDEEARALALEEDLVVLDEGEEGPHTMASFAPLEVKVETKQERKAREKRDKQERKRAQLVEDDRRIGDELARLGF